MKKTLLLLTALFLLAGSQDLLAGRKAKHVIVIGIDGWASWCLQQADPATLPNIHYLMDNGSYTLKKRSVMPSASAINWASIFMGVPTEMHCYNAWNSKEPAIPAACVNERGIPPTIYSVLREQHPKAETGVVFNWDGIGFVTDTAVIDHVVYDAGYHNPSSGYTLEKYTREHALPYIKEKKPELFTFYIGDQDEVGHALGWGSPEYYQCMAEIDRSVGLILQAIKEAGIEKNTVVIMTSDHGGKGRGHGGFTLDELETPYILYGSHIKKGCEITDVVMQYDHPATSAYILGLKAPQSWVGRPVKSAFK